MSQTPAAYNIPANHQWLWNYIQQHYSVPQRYVFSSPYGYSYEKPKPFAPENYNYPTLEELEFCSGVSMRELDAWYSAEKFDAAVEYVVNSASYRGNQEASDFKRWFEDEDNATLAYFICITDASYTYMLSHSNNNRWQAVTASIRTLIDFNEPPGLQHVQPFAP